jgi:signal transduction histidine kinase
MRLAMQGIVTRLGHTCLLANDGREAWQTLQAQKVDVVITDWTMPDMDGIELCHQIRANSSEVGYVYVLMASAHDQADEIRDGMLAGADGYLTKPLCVAQLERNLIAAERVTALHARLGVAHQALADVNRQQADMIAMLGHDARQPLTAIIGYSDANLDGWETVPDPVRRSLVVKVANAARRLDQLIEDVLTMANLDSGVITVRAQAVPVAAAIQEVISCDPTTFQITITGDQEIQVLVDPWHLRQIIANLLGNAVKYGREPIVVLIGEAEARVRIGISDQGEGVPAEFVPDLFKRFSRADTGIATLKSGTGFGLYIVQQLAEINDGKISYAPGDKGGSCFTLELPSPGADLVHPLPALADRPAR